MNLEQLIQQEKELKSLLIENRNKQRELNKAAFIAKHGFKIGDAVQWVGGSTQRKGVIVDIEFSGATPSRYVVKLFNSDGEIGKREVRIWSFAISSVKLIVKD